MYCFLWWIWDRMAQRASERVELRARASETERWMPFFIGHVINGVIYLIHTWNNLSTSASHVALFLVAEPERANEIEKARDRMWEREREMELKNFISVVALSLNLCPYNHWNNLYGIFARSLILYVSYALHPHTLYHTLTVTLRILYYHFCLRFNVILSLVLCTTW